MVARADWKRHRSAFVAAGNHFCAICGAQDDIEVHHIVPFRRGADNSPANLVALCTKHHVAVAAITKEFDTWPEERQRMVGAAIKARMDDLWYRRVGMAMRR